MGEWPHSGIEGFHIALDDEVPSMLAGISVAEFNHLAELPFAVDMHKRERHFAWCKGLLCKSHHNGTVLANAVEHNRVLELRSHFTDNVN